MALARWNGVVQDAAGNAVSGASIEVRDETTGFLVPLFSDRDGTVGLGNPYVADGPEIAFHARGGNYRVKATKGTEQKTWRWVAMGTAQALDADQIATYLQAGIVPVQTRPELDDYAPAIPAPGAPETPLGGVVYADPDTALNGYYTYNFTTSEWDFARPLSDTLAGLSVVSVDDNEISAAASPGVNPAGVKAFYLDLDDWENTGPVTIRIDGAAAIPVVDVTGGEFLPGFATGRLFLSNEGSSLRMIVGGDYMAAVTAAIDAAIRAEAAAAGLNLPTIQPGDERKQLYVKPDLSGYELDKPARGGGDLFKTVSDMHADDNVVIGYEGSGAEVEVSDGDIISAGAQDGQSFPYGVRASGAVDNTDITTGGVKLFNLSRIRTLEMFGGGVDKTPAENRLAWIAAASTGLPVELRGRMYPSHGMARVDGAKLYGDGGGWLFTKGDGISQVFGQFGDDGIFEDVRFVSLEEDLQNQRCSPGRWNRIIRCHFEGFRSVTGTPNAWGLYLKYLDVGEERWWCEGNHIEDCTFYNNSVNDVAIVDGARNNVFINLQNKQEDGVNFNLEPNADVVNIGTTVIGGKFRDFYIQENSFTSNANQETKVIGAIIEKLWYDGGDVDFDQCKIDSIVEPPGFNANSQYVAGKLKINTCDLGENLIIDPTVFDLNRNSVGDNSYWYMVNGSYSTDRYSRVGDPNGSINLCVPGTAMQSGVQQIWTRNFILGFNEGEYVAAVFRGGVDSGTGVADARNMQVIWYDSSDTVVGTNNIATRRHALGSSAPIATVVAVLKVPSGAVKCRVMIGKIINTTSRVIIQSVGLHRIQLGEHKGNWNNVIEAHKADTIRSEHFQSHAPVATANWDCPGNFVGERITRMPPVVGQPKGWRCTVAGSTGAPGTWVSEGNL